MSVTLASSLTLPQASAELVRLSQAVRSHGGEVVIDASALKELDSSAVAVLLQCRRDALAAGQSFRLTQAPEKLKALMALYGVVELFDAASDQRAVK